MNKVHTYCSSSHCLRAYFHYSFGPSSYQPYGPSIAYGLCSLRLLCVLWHYCRSVLSFCLHSASTGIVFLVVKLLPYMPQGLKSVVNNGLNAENPYGAV